MRTLTRRNRLRGIAVSIAALTAVSSPMLAQTSNAADAPVIKTSPTDTPRGPQASMPYLVDGAVTEDQVNNRVILDGALRVPTPAGKNTELFTKRGSDYLIRSDQHLYRVAADGSSQVLVKGAPGSVLATENGKRAALAKREAMGKRRDRPVPVKVVNTKNGDVLAKRSFPGRITILAVDGDEVLASYYVGYGQQQRTIQWNYKKGAVRTLTHTAGYEVDRGGNRLASFVFQKKRTCTIITKLSNPAKRLWKTCDGTSVDTFGPNGAMVTLSGTPSAALLGDVVLRDRVGEVLVGYDVPTLFKEFTGGFTQFEKSGALLIGEASRDPGPTALGLARCTLDRCEPAGDTWTVTTF